eukprot:5688791-Alexandrium_andersonii.AAC.1
MASTAPPALSPPTPFPHPLLRRCGAWAWTQRSWARSAARWTACSPTVARRSRRARPSMASSMGRRAASP